MIVSSIFKRIEKKRGGGVISLSIYFLLVLPKRISCNGVEKETDEKMFG